MRRLAIAISLAGLSFAAHAATAEPPDDALRSKVLEERDDGQWHGHQNWLYDKENQPETNAAASNPPDCAEYRIRVPKADAGTEIKRIQKCD